MTLAFHPLATIFPPIEGAEFNDFVENIRRHGVREKIVLWNGEVLEGRNRFRALTWLVSTGEVLGKGWGHREGLHLTEDELTSDNVWFTQFNPDVDGDPLSFVLSKNLHRRHLTESQRAMVAANIATLKQGARTDLAPIGAKSDADAAKMLNVGERSVERAKVVQRGALPEVREAVTRGNLAVSAAAEVAQLPAERQQELIKSLPRDQAGNLTPDAIKQLKPLIKEVRVVEQAQKRERREEREQDLAQKIADLPHEKFGVIYADPEWRFEPYSRESGMDRAADNHYPTSVTEAIAARPVQAIAADDCVLFLWATAPMLPDALQVMAAWGFAYRSHIIWKKDRVGTGYWFRNRHELLLVGARGNVPAPAQGDQWPSIIDQMVQEHSAKPEAFHELIETYFPNLPKIELNARRARAGWKTWGLEAPEQQNSTLPDLDSEWGPASEAAAALPESINQAAAANHTDAHGSTASAVAGAVVAAAPASLPEGEHPLDIPAFLRRKPDEPSANVFPLREAAS